MSSLGDKIPVDVSVKYMHDKKTKHDVLMLNDFFMPKLTSSIVSIRWMEAIREHRFTCWCPKDTEKRVCKCIDPPTIEALAAFLQEELKKKNRSLGHYLTLPSAKLPDKKWMIMVLSTLEPNHKIFGKKYRPPAPASKEETTVYISNHDNLFDDLPELYKMKDIKSAATAVIPAE